MSICIEGKLRWPVIRWLAARGMLPVFEVILSGQCDIVGVEFVRPVAKNSPKILQCHAIELKIDDASGALRQAQGNRYHVPYSWAAMPMARVQIMREATLNKFRSSGVGLLAVGKDAEIVVEAALSLDIDPSRIAAKLWRRRDEWASRVDSQKIKRSRVSL